MNRWRTLSQSLFGLLLFLLLASHASENGGPFTWLALPTAVSGQSWQIGVLALLPVVVAAGWWLENRPARLWWGETAVSLHLAAFSLLTLLRLTPATAHLAAMLALVWFVYLFLVNHMHWQANWLWRVLAAVLLVQSGVAVAQFLLQRELGLAWLGEPSLDLLVEGTSVAQRDGQNWLRAYGLNSHPNQLGLLLTALILLVWPQHKHAKGGLWAGLYWLALAAGMAGLLVSLSRSAWLALVVGGLVLAWPRGRANARSWREFALPLAVFSAGLLLFALLYGDVLAGRLVALDSPLEQRSLWERQRDWGIALQLVGERPFLGTGPGQYLPAAQAVDPAAVTVHNVPLLVAAELGLLGLVVWLAFWLWPLVRYGRSPAHRGATAVWLALIVMAMLHPEPTLFLPKGAVLWGIAAAQWPGGAA
jgi:O-antigen ligase